MKSLIASLLLVAGVIFGTAGCEEAEELYDCAVICESFGDCAEELGVDVDEVSCAEDCETAADTEPGFAAKAENCQSCLDTLEMCTDQFECADECAGVVPELALPE